MRRFLSLFSVLTIAASSITFSATSIAWAETVTLSTGACSQMVQHVPADDVTYKPGVDVHGKAVVPADLGSSSGGGGANITMPDQIDIQIGIDLADRLALRDAKKPQVLTPGLPGTTTPGQPARKVLPYEGKAAIGVLTIKGNDAFWNGERIAPQDEVLLAEACRKGMTAAGMILPTPKPKP